MSRVARIASYSIREEARKKEFPEVFVGLESISRLQSVKGSNAIEGILTTDKRIEEIVSKKSAPLNHDEEDIAGYRDALDIIHDNHDSMRIDGTTIRDLHRIMLSHSSEDGGAYKKEDNVIIRTDTSGRRYIHYEPVPAAETEDSMEQMLLAYADARSDSRIDNLLLTPCFILDFLCIHPFLDGNGRMSRLLSLLLMYKGGIDVGKYISFEEMINKNK
ncbi:MAG: Fic family protein, partial [Candidatus Methanoplasma sp.]|nr:Fic family protein [Candidatus Methanoplasma sp.]